MAADSPVVVVLARPVTGAAKLPPEWRASLEKGHLAVVSGVAIASRLTQQPATDRNALAARLAQRIVVAHASPAGSLAAQLEQWHLEGHWVDVLSAS